MANNPTGTRVKFIFFLSCVFVGVGISNLILQGLGLPAVYSLTFKVPSTRGKIFDVYGRLCAYDEIVYSAYLDVDFLKSRFKERLMPHLKLLIANFSLPYSPEQLLSNSKRFVKLGQAKERDELLSKVPTELIPFVSIEYETVRKRFEDYGMGKILGKVIDGKGFGGVEEALNSTLARQKDGKIRIRYKGFLTTTLVIETIASPRNGKDISLTIDLDLQKIAYEEIKNAVQKNRAVSGGVIILETKTGKIRAMVTTREWNDAIMGYFEPGSAIKPIVYAIALEEKIVDLQTIFQCEGKIKPIDDVDIVVRDLYVHGKVDLTEALVESCNSATILLARQIKEKLGDYNYYQWLEKFGFGKPTKVQLAGEISGVLRKPESWSKIDFAMISIGQSIGTTPLQFAAAFNTIANRGVYVAPTIIEDFETEKRKVLSPEVCDKIVQILHQVVERGTGVRAKVPNVGIAGKTGTAQKVAAGEDKYYSIFAGFFPYEDPQYTILVWLDEPSANAYLAGEVAAPIFAKIVQRITKLSREQVISFQEGLMPDLRGLTVKDALFILKQLNVEEIEIVGTGIVKNQYPPPGSVELEKVILFLGY